MRSFSLERLDLRLFGQANALISGGLPGNERNYFLYWKFVKSERLFIALIFRVRNYSKEVPFYYRHATGTPPIRSGKRNAGTMTS